MMATYSFLITGEMALEAAKIFNRSIATTQGQLITDDGISFSSHDSLNDVATTSSSSQENDTDTVDLYIFIMVIAVVVAVLLIVMVAVTIVM